MSDLYLREKMVSASLVIVIVWLGLSPNMVFNTAKPALFKTLNEHIENTIRDPVTIKNKAAKKNLFLFSEIQRKH